MSVRASDSHARRPRFESGLWFSICPFPGSEVLLPGGLGQVLLYAAFGSVAHLPGCYVIAVTVQQTGCTITAHVPVISGPSQSRTRQSFNAIAGCGFPLRRKMSFLAARRFKCERQGKRSERTTYQHQQDVWGR